MRKAIRGEAGTVPRDRWNRPMIDGEAYTRASTLANAIESTFGLEQWKRRQVAIGLALRDDLRALAASNADDATTMNRVANDAMDAAEAHAGANLGTAIHSLTENIDLGKPLPKGTPKELISVLEAYKEVTTPLSMRVVEMFVATKEVMAAGTFDRIVGYDNQLFIADIKTGKNAPLFANGAQVQMSVYAHGRAWAEHSGWYPKTLAEMGINQERAIMIHVPVEGDPGLFWVDIDAGWDMALIAYRVRQWWKTTPAEKIR